MPTRIRVIIRPGLALRAAPHPTAQYLGRAAVPHKAVKQALEAREGWYKVRVGEVEGWVPAAGCEAL